MATTSLLLLLLALSCVAEETRIPELYKNKIQNLIDSKKIKRDVPTYSEPVLNDEEEYDFIIVGAGSSGSALVNRLSEVRDWKILLLEAGGQPDILTDVPMLAPLTHFTDQNWNFHTEKEDNFAKGFKNHRMHWPRGKGLGGSSLINYMFFSRGARQDYDKWASLGNPGWSYEDVLPYFKKMENCKIKHQDHEYRGTGGELHVEDSFYRSKGVDVFMDAVKSRGYKYVDYNGREHVGVSYSQLTTVNGIRCSGESCFIRKAKDRENLTIRTMSHVTKVIIDNSNRARGVEFIKNGKLYKAFAKKEVILSAGVINSAHILMLSGIGPKKDLEKFDIKVVQDLPVGKKIYDHPAYWFLTFYTDEPLNYDKSALTDDENYINLYNKGEGPLHCLGGVDAVLFARTPLAKHENLSDVEILFWALHFGSDEDYGIGRSFGISPDLYDKIYRPVLDKNLFSLVIMLLQPESYGHLELRSKSPLDHPKLYGGYFTDPNGRDMKTMIAGIKEALSISSADAFKKHGVKLLDIPIPGCEHLTFGSDEYWECAVRHGTSTVYHHTTTCKMGPKNDPEAVVDHRLRVYGVDGLRVADTSIIPIQITGHTNVPAYLVGVKAAALIREDHGATYNVKDEL